MYVLQAGGDAARFLLLFIGVGHIMFGSSNQSYLIVVIKIEQHVILCLSIFTCWDLKTLIFWPQIKTIINNDVCWCAIFRGFMLFCVISFFI